MATLSLKIQDKEGKTLCVGSGEDMASLVYAAEYEEGDHIILETSEKGIHLFLQVDDALGHAFCYVTDTVHYYIPFGERRISYSPKAFSGNRHYLHARVAREDEVSAYRNLALNINDQHGDTHCYPHATANVETRGESVFAARNAIDGVLENRSHGEWPYESWGINRNPDAELVLEFGREVEADVAAVVLRADFPHDSWWTQVTLEFSDGTALDWKLEKNGLPQTIFFGPKRISWVKLCRLKKAEDASPFPALTQIEIYGKDCIRESLENNEKSENIV